MSQSTWPPGDELHLTWGDVCHFLRGQGGDVHVHPSFLQHALTMPLSPWRHALGCTAGPGPTTL